MRNDYIAVAGGVNVDIGGTSFKPLIRGDSNPGTVKPSLGGVGRNIAHNLSLMGQKVTLLTAFGYDVFGQRIIAECENEGIDLSAAVCAKDAETSTYVYLCGPDGEMELAVSDMRICDKLTPNYFEKQLPRINGAKLLVIDANLPEESIDYLTDKVTVPVFADMVSSSKAEKVAPYVSRLHTIKPNKIEAEIITGIKINDEESLKEAGFRLLDMGVKNAYISLSENGIAVFASNEMKKVKACKSEVVNVTGAGDAALAALAYSCLLGLSPFDAAKYANAAASIAVESRNTVSEYMSICKMEGKIQENY